MASDHVQRLLELYRRESKHSAYQVLAPSVARVLGDPPLEMKSRHEGARLACLRSRVSLDGARVLDIGGNTGFFTFSAIEHGATSVDYYEGNATHAAFVRASRDALGLDERVRVHDRYFTFDPAPSQDTFDVCLCLNVVHHLGDDFGDRSLSLERARAQMIGAVNALATLSTTLVLQVGFNWKGDVGQPLFARGLKREMIDFVVGGTSDDWEIESVQIAEDGDDGVVYAPAGEENLQRIDRLGEFLNRPLFFLRSRRRG